MKRAMILAALLVIVSVVALMTRGPGPRRDAARTMPHGKIPMSVGTEDDPHAQAEMEFLMLRDPKTNAIPLDIRRREALFANALRLENEANGVFSADAVTWTERGPNNVGGRTRAFGIDAANATTLLAGSVAGGIWKSTNDGASWSLRTAPAQIHGTTCLAQDRRIGKTHLWYAGTGEMRGSTNNDTRWGSLYRGDGIFKSTDNGDSWTLLPSTSSGTPQSTDAFDYVMNVATNPAASGGQDHVFAATYNGIYRSIDGGGTWAQALASDSGFTDVAVTSGGVAYAFTRSGGAPRIWRSPDGVTWTNITPSGIFPSATRIVIGLVPSNPNAAYFFLNYLGAHQLWKYTYVSGNGSGAGGTWENRTALPAINTQSGYDMVLHVKPNDENFILIGGTDLYRSTNGFTSTATTVVIGGYPFFPGGDHHPDLHSGAFSPVNPNVYYSTHDGGISRAADITLANMVWTSLNHGYNVTQFYSVSIAPESGSNLLLAGAQDNGTQLGDALGASDWIMAYGGDGMVAEIAPLADDRLYTQYQNGHMQRQNRDGSGLAEEIQPDGAVNQLFVNPLVLDPNDSSLLYYPAGISSTSSRIWRNDSAPFAEATFGWTSLEATEVGAGVGYTRRITALGISTANNPNVLYYGTVDGLVYRADGANGSPTVTNVTPPGLNGGTATGGFVRCIAVDPWNSNRALVAFGNYNFRSLWLTTDGGASWTDVEGNLAGASGPSIRWATVFHVGATFHVFLGTSIGVLSTTALAGNSTVWTQEAATEIGNVIIGSMDYRPADQTLAVGTHARGVFTGQIGPMVDVGRGAAGRGAQVALYPSYPNPMRGSANIAYDLPRAGPVSLRVYDVTGREVASLVDGIQDRGRHEARFTAGRLPAGVYYYVLRTENGSRTRKLSLMR